VDISAGVDRTLPENTVETLLQSLNIMYSRLASIQLCNADVVIKPKVGYIGSSDFSKRHEAILEGEKAALEALPRIMEILTQLRREGRLE
jgi:NTE family protein